MVEALTIVLAVGVTRGWRSALAGVGVATVTLAAIIAGLGPALHQVPIDALRLVVGFLLLAFGLQWLRKAILRASGFKALHDEEEIFCRNARRPATRPGTCAWASTGTRSSSASKECSSRAWRSPSSSSRSGAPRATSPWPPQRPARTRARGRRRRRRPSASQPGTREHVEVRGRGHADHVRDLLERRGNRGVVARRRARAPRDPRVRGPLVAGARASASAAARSVASTWCAPMRRVKVFARFWWEFIVGDDWRIAAGLAVALGLLVLLVHEDLAAWWLLPLAVLGLLAESLRRARATPVDPARRRSLAVRDDAFGCMVVAPRPCPERA